jgi:hypothetical protein
MTKDKEKKINKVLITQGGLTITILGKWCITLFSKLITKEDIDKISRKL